MMAAEEAGQFVYIPAEEGGDSDPVSTDHSESSKPAEDKTPASLPKSPKSPASPVKTHVSILHIISGIRLQDMRVCYFPVRFDKTRYMTHISFYRRGFLGYRREMRTQ